jgi:hypothetical protein
MAPALSPFFQDHSFDPFLFAAIGEERNGMMLSVLSALARLGLDPWFEAASRSKLPAPAATERLTSLLSALPSSQLKAPAPATIMRLVGLLPRAVRDVAWSPGAAVVAKPKMSWPMAAYFVAVFVIICAAQFAERRESKAPAAGAAPLLAASPETGEGVAVRRPAPSSRPQ